MIVKWSESFADKNQRRTHPHLRPGGSADTVHHLPAGELGAGGAGTTVPAVHPGVRADSRPVPPEDGAGRNRENRSQLRHEHRGGAADRLRPQLHILGYPARAGHVLGQRFHLHYVRYSLVPTEETAGGRKVPVYLYLGKTEARRQSTG